MRILHFYPKDDSMISLYVTMLHEELNRTFAHLITTSCIFMVAGTVLCISLLVRLLSQKHASSFRPMDN